MNKCEFCGKELCGLMENIDHAYECTEKPKVEFSNMFKPRSVIPFVFGADMAAKVSEILTDLYKQHNK